MPESDSTRCPLCGQTNQCAVAAGLPPERCWCMRQPVSQTALQRLPPQQRGRVCICPQCARPLSAPEPGAQPI